MAFGIVFLVLSTIAMVRMVGELRSGSPRWYRIGVLGLVTCTGLLVGVWSVVENLV